MHKKYTKKCIESYFGSKILKSDSRLPKKFALFASFKNPLKRIKNAFHFILKALFVLKILLSFYHEFLVIRKNGLIRKTRLISKLMTSQPGQRTIEIHILSNISWSKSNQTMKLGLIEYNKRSIFLQKLCRKWGRETSSRPLLIFLKCLIWGKSCALQLSFNIFRKPSTWHTVKTNCIKL